MPHFNAARDSFFICVPQDQAIIQQIFLPQAAQANLQEVLEYEIERYVRANTYGIHSHGVVRFADYVNAIKSGKVKPAATPVVVKDSAVIVVLDAQWGFGQVAAERAMQLRRAG